MKVYTVDAAKVSNTVEVIKHTISYGVSIPVVAVGEAGRGRKYAYLVVDLLPKSKQHWEQMGSVQISAVKVGQTKAGAPKLIETADSLDEGWLALTLTIFRTQIGYRGSNSHKGDYLGGYYEGTEPKAAHCADFPGLILAEGMVAQGIAGNMGSGKQLIAILKVGDIVRTGYGGRLYGAPAAHYYKVLPDSILCATWEERQIADLF